MSIEVRHHHHYHGNGAGDGVLLLVLLLLLVPPLLPLIALEHYSWVFMASHHWHPVFKGAIAIGEFVGVLYGLVAFCAYASEKAVAWTATAYMGVMYGGFAALNLTSDRIWIIATTLISGAVGYALGIAGSRAARRGDSEAEPGAL